MIPTTDLESRIRTNKQPRTRTTAIVAILGTSTYFATMTGCAAQGGAEFSLFNIKAGGKYAQYTETDPAHRTESDAHLFAADSEPYSQANIEHARTRGMMEAFGAGYNNGNRRRKD